MSRLFLTLFVAVICGLFFHRWKVPAGLMVGSVFGCMLLSVTTGMAYMPASGKFLAQAVAGIYIASTLRRDDLKRIAQSAAPVSVAMVSLFLLTAAMGFCISRISGLDLLSALMSAVPGGITDISIISADMGADAASVAVLQFVRLVLGIGAFPLFISWLDHSNAAQSIQTQPRVDPVLPTRSLGNAVITMSVGLLSALLGLIVAIPAGVLIFSLLGVVILSFKTDRVYVPPRIRYLAQILAGAYIGSGISPEDAARLRYLLLPAAIIILGYSLNCLLMGWLLRRWFKFSRREAMLMATPAGASDMALIAVDLGVHSPLLIAFQVFRMLLSITVFPQFVRLLVLLFG